MIVIQVAGALLFAASTAYLLLALIRVRGYRECRLSPTARPPVTILLPCHDAPPRLYECLHSVCTQDYPGLQVVFGLHSADDPARDVIDRLLADRPDLDATIVADRRRLGANPKNCNLANMLPAARHDILVIVDSDVLVGPGFLDTIVAPLADPGIGAVTCLYKGLPEPGLPSRLGALYVNDWFIPSVLVDLGGGRRNIGITYGAATAVSRRALAAIGGFAAMASAVAQDYVLGHRLRRAGFTIRLAPQVVGTVIAEPSLRSLYRHELRWMRAIRAVRPLDHLLWIVTSAFVPLLLLAAAWPGWVGLPALAVYVGLRLAVHRGMRRRIPLPAAEPLLLPVRELANFVLWLGSLLGRRVQWGDSVLVTGDGLSMHRDRAAPEPPQMPRQRCAEYGGCP